MSIIQFPTAHPPGPAGLQAPALPPHSHTRGRLRALHRDETGAATAEYAIVIMAAVALASVLVAVVQSDAVHSVIENLVMNAFQGG